MVETVLQSRFSKAEIFPLLAPELSGDFIFLSKCLMNKNLRPLRMIIFSCLALILVLVRSSLKALKVKHVC